MFIVIVQSPVDQSACARGTVNFTCVVMFNSGSPGSANWFTNNDTTDATTRPGHTRTDDSNERSAPANVTNVLTVTNLSISNNGADYICTQGIRAISDTAFLTVFGKLFIRMYIHVCMNDYGYVNIYQNFHLIIFIKPQVHA